MTTIQIKKTHEEPGEASLAVTVPPENVREAEERATRDWQSRARLPGFRKGKAPTAVVRKRFADDIRQQVLQELLKESWKAALSSSCSTCWRMSSAKRLRTTAVDIRQQVLQELLQESWKAALAQE